MLKFHFHLLIKIDSSCCIQDWSNEDQEQEESSSKGIASIWFAKVYLHGKGQKVHNDERNPSAAENDDIPNMAEV